MANAFKCDACGKYYDKRYLFISENDRETIERIMLLNKYNHNIGTYDLCDDCLKKVLDILGVEYELEEAKKND